MKKMLLACFAVLLALAGEVQADVPRKEEIPKYIKQLQSSTIAKVRADAAEAIGRRGAVRKKDVLAGIEPLISALKKDKDASVRKNAAEALGKIGPDDKIAVPPLMEALKDPAVPVKIAAANALGMLGPEAKEAVPALREMMQEAGKDRKNRPMARAANMAIRAIMGRRKK